jgi:hypothetical protein
MSAIYAHTFKERNEEISNAIYIFFSFYITKEKQK